MKSSHWLFPTFLLSEPRPSGVLKAGDWKREAKGDQWGRRESQEEGPGEAKTHMAGKVGSLAEPGILVTSTQVQAHAAVLMASHALVNTSTPINVLVTSKPTSLVGMAESLGRRGGPMRRPRLWAPPKMVLPKQTHVSQ